VFRASLYWSLFSHESIAELNLAASGVPPATRISRSSSRASSHFPPVALAATAEP
ncbi:unnamed protein product, partial [Ectocarpus sp. 12 AP-2014]